MSTPAAPPIDLNDITLTDETVALDYVSKVPLAMRMALGDNLKAMLLSVISRERARCKTLLAMGARFNENQVRAIEGGIQAAIVSGNQARAQELGSKRIESIAMARALTAAVQIVAREPGGCGKCGGTKMVPSSVAMPGGQRALLPCPACNNQEVGAAPAPADATAPASNSSNGTPLSLVP